jgi:hypothetical protein
MPVLHSVHRGFPPCICGDALCRVRREGGPNPNPNPNPLCRVRREGLQCLDVVVQCVVVVVVPSQMQCLAWPPCCQALGSAATAAARAGVAHPRGTRVHRARGGHLQAGGGGCGERAFLAWVTVALTCRRSQVGVTARVEGAVNSTAGVAGDPAPSPTRLPCLGGTHRHCDHDSDRARVEPPTCPPRHHRLH